MSRLAVLILLLALTGCTALNAHYPDLRTPGRQSLSPQQKTAMQRQVLRLSEPALRLGWGNHR